MKQVTINLVSFDELSEESKQRAIVEHKSFLESTEENGTDEYTEDEVIENIVINEYWFFEDGELAHTVLYTGKQEKSGMQEFYFHGRTIDITK